MSRLNLKAAAPYVGLLAVLVSIIALTVTLTNDEPGSNQVVVQVDSNGNGSADKTVAAPAPLVEKIQRTELGDHENARDEAPAIAPPEELAAAKAQQQRIKRTLDPLPTAGATASIPGCVTRFVSNQSARNGVRPIGQVVHYTVSANRPGWADVNAIVAYFDQRSSSASSHFVIDREGHCAYIVPLEAKAWTAAALNPTSIQYEVINTGSEGTFMDTAGYAKLRAVMRTVANRTGIPMRLGAISGCRYTRTGIVSHQMGGACAGGHHDVSPFSISEIVRIVSSGALASNLTKNEATVAYKRCYHRAEHLAGRNRPGNLRWARFYRDRILIPNARSRRVGGHVQLIPAIDAAKRTDGKPWAYRHRASRRAELATKFSGKGC